MSHPLLQTREGVIQRSSQKAQTVARPQRGLSQKDKDMPKRRSSPTRRRRTTVRAFHYAAKSGHILATTLWIALLATGIALQFLWGIALGFAEGIQQLKNEMKTARLGRQNDSPELLPPPDSTSPANIPKTKWNYVRPTEKTRRIL